MPFATAIEIGCHVFLRTCHPSAGGRDVWSVLTRHAWTVFGRRLKGRTKHALKEDFLVLRSCVFALSKPASGSLERLCTSVRSGRCLPTSPFSPYSFCLSSLKSVFSPLSLRGILSPLLAESKEMPPVVPFFQRKSEKVRHSSSWT